MSERDDIAWEEQQKLRARFHDFTTRVATIEMLLNNRNEKIEDLSDDLEKLDQRLDDANIYVGKLQVKVDKLEQTISTYNKFLWGLAVAVFGAIGTFITDGVIR